MSILKIGISSRALFDLNEGHEIYKKKGIEKYADYQRKNEDVSLDKGVAFYSGKDITKELPSIYLH